MIDPRTQPLADLCYVNLRGANLHHANLHHVNLHRVNLHHADLRFADLRFANLQGANLQGANLQGANLQGANLQGANLHGADLHLANLHGADLRGTTLDPAAIPRSAYTALLMAGLELDADGWVWGWRSAHSLLICDTHYAPRPEPYEAPVLSVCPDTACHPGIYFASRDELKQQYPMVALVRCRARIEETHVVSREKGARTRRLWVVGGAS